MFRFHLSFHWKFDQMFRFTWGFHWKSILPDRCIKSCGASWISCNFSKNTYFLMKIEAFEAYGSCGHFAPKIIKNIKYSKSYSPKTEGWALNSWTQRIGTFLCCITMTCHTRHDDCDIFPNTLLTAYSKRGDRFAFQDSNRDTHDGGFKVRYHW